MAALKSSSLAAVLTPCACESQRPSPDQVGAGGSGVDFPAELIRHQRRIYLYIGTLLANPSDIEDVYQQACLAMWQKRDQLRDVRNFFAFACGFARNEALHVIRRNVRKGHVHLSEQMIGLLADEAEREQAGDAYLAALTHCLAKLPADHQALLKRRYSGLETVKQIAAEVRVSAAALTMRLQRIRHALVKCIEGRLAMEEGR